MPLLQSIDEVVKVPEPLEEAVSTPVEALMSEARWEIGKEQQIYMNTEMYDEVQRTVDAQNVYKWLWIPSGGMEPDRRKRGDDMATNEANEEWASVEEQQVVEQATDESQDWCMHKMYARWVAGKTLETENVTKGKHLEEWCRSSTLARRRGR